VWLRRRDELIEASAASCAPIVTRFARTRKTFALIGAMSSVTWSIGELICVNTGRIDVKARHSKSCVPIEERSDRTRAIFAATAETSVAISEIDTVTFAIIDGTAETRGETSSASC
jgi:hypothetical protein